MMQETQSSDEGLNHQKTNRILSYTSNGMQMTDSVPRKEEIAEEDASTMATARFPTPEVSSSSSSEEAEEEEDKKVETHSSWCWGWLLYQHPGCVALLLFSILTTLLLVLVVPLAIFLSPGDRPTPSIIVHNDASSSSSSSPSHIPTATPSLRLPTIHPTQNPTTMAPTSPAPTSTEDRWMEWIVDASNLFDDNGGTALQEDGTPQARAFAWMTDHHQSSWADWASSRERVLQRYALTTFLFSTMGPEKAQSGWISRNQDVCEWSVLTYSSGNAVCNGQGLVVQMLLQHVDELHGTLPRELIFLSDSLEQLILRNSHVGGTIPTEYGLLTKLQSLDVASNSLTGTIPTELGSLAPALTWCNLAANTGLVGTLPTELFALTSCTYLGLAMLEGLSGTLPSQVGLLTHLTRLSLRGANLHGDIPTEIGHITLLTQLLLVDNAFSGSIPSEMGRLTDLLELDFRNNQARSSP
eukprot:CAMPEP_0116869440 /NCGR_PEP_ID=MMETSP0418-20121206/27762_1 /TAXON_ID=1158023 /ORGANISM="Astrosyne radiata, Strain 13vi08-1A" /LENGTH=468 /DNA_ID=CAMNT_0004505539 /DNA_START=336 /DNA_END=1742 /DNA_ORIENTATION=-